MQPPVSVHTEWEPLEEVVIGSCMNFNLQGIDAVFRFLYENKDGKFRERREAYDLAQQYISERQEDLDNIQRLLEREDVIVRRVKRLEQVDSISTPTFQSYTTASDSPRDMYLLVGNEIIETPPTNRKRYFEHLLLRDLFHEYFQKGARWSLAPRPSLAEERLDLSYWKEHLDDTINRPEQLHHQYEIAFDAANCLKFGKDIVMNVGTKNQELGATWLQRHLGEEYTVHPIRLCDSHIDGHIMPLAPGKLLVNEVAMHNHYHRLPKALQKWDRIPILDQATGLKQYSEKFLQMASEEGMSVNVLSIDQKKVLIRDNAQLTIDALYREGFEPIPVRLRHSELFGGGIHCSTVDVRRKDQREDYFS